MTLSLEDAVKEAARIIYVAHEDSKDKEFELEMTWVSRVGGPTQGRHESVPEALREEAERLAKKALEGEDEDEEGEGGGVGEAAAVAAEGEGGGEGDKMEE